MKRVFKPGVTMLDPQVKASPEKPVTAFYLQDKYKDFERQYAYPQNAAAEETALWRRELTCELKKVFTLDVLGDVPTPAYQVLKQEDTENYSRRLIAYEVMEGNWVQAYLLIPYKLPAPAVLCLHGHFPGAKDSVVFPECAAGKAYGHELACRGFVVLAPDGAGMSAREHWGANTRDVPADYSVSPREGGCELLFRRLNHMGIDLTGFRVFELMAGINMLLSMPSVKGKEVGCAGLSGGCWLTQVLTALDNRVKASILSGYFTTFVQTAWLGHCICHHPFGIGRLCDMPDISALAAPRPQFVESGSEDTNYPVEPAFSICMAAYKDLQADSNFKLHLFDGGHGFDGEQSIPWICEQFGFL
jgi:dienelactone hydrolase